MYFDPRFIRSKVIVIRLNLFRTNPLSIFLLREDGLTISENGL